MPDFSRWGANGGDPSLNAVARTDRYLDALAAEQQVYATDTADAELANLMAGWRDEVRRPPARVASQREAELVLQRALSSRRRTRMSMAVFGSVAAAVLCLGGFGAVVSSAGPGDSLYGLRVSLFGQPQVTRDDKVALAAQTEMQQVQQLIDQGNWEAAQSKLQTVTSTVQTVEDPQRQQELQQQLKNLTVKVETHDPNATVPQSVPVGPSQGIQLPPGISLPPGLPLPTDASVPPLPGPVVIPPEISLPTLPLPQLPGPGVPPEISLPSLPPILLPQKPIPDGPKPATGDQNPGSKPNPDGPKQNSGDQSGQNPNQGDQKPAPKPQSQGDPSAFNPPPDSAKRADQPKQLAPDLPVQKPAPASQTPSSQEAPQSPVIPVVPAPKAPPASAPAQEQSPTNPTTTLFPVPGVPPQKSKQGD